MPMTLLFSDVDGTLLDRQGRFAMTAQELAPHLRTLQIVLASSRTVRELADVQRALGITGPVVAENGAVIGLPWDANDTAPASRTVIDGRAWSLIGSDETATSLQALVREAARAVGVSYVDQVDVEPMVDRRRSVALRAAGDGDDQLATLLPLLQALRGRGLTVASGGAWWLVTRDADKGRGALQLLERLRQTDARVRDQLLVIAAVGDGDNDVPLLQVVEQRFAIARADGTWHADLRAVAGVRLVQTPGIDGWCDVIEALARTAVIPEEA
jgi:HAD superfamily hydrolase (TIGR01484 family)